MTQPNPSHIHIDPDARRITGQHEGQDVSRDLTPSEMDLVFLSLLAGSPPEDYTNMVAAKHPAVRGLAGNGTQSMHELTDKVGVAGQ